MRYDFSSMSRTLTIRLSEELAERLEELSRRTGNPVGKIICDQLERLREEDSRQRFLRHAGKIRGPRDLSMRKSFSCFKP